jgi:DNA-binding transcriptional regulator YiaG
MGRTEILQENRKMRFEEVYGGRQKRRLSHDEAAEILGVCNQTPKRLKAERQDQQMILPFRLLNMSNANPY